MLGDLRSRAGGRPPQLHDTSRTPVIISNVSSSSSGFDSDNVDDLVDRVQSLLAADMLACDVQVSLFVAASQSYRQDSTLRPFPPMYLSSDGERDIKSLMRTVSSLPPLSSVLKDLEQGRGVDTETLALLAWILTGGPSKLSLKSLSSSQAEEVLSLAGPVPSSYPQPAFVLEVKTNGSEKWRLEMLAESSFWAFHGSRLDNFHSILSHGLQQHRTKNSLFGEGIYLASDLGVCLAYSSRGVGWANSCLGPSLSCLAVTQVKHHQDVKVHTEEPGRGMVEDSEGGRVPEKYVVVRNNELVKIKYLLVYQHEPKVEATSSNAVMGWVKENKMIMLLLAYAFLLVCIGLSNSVTFKRWLRRSGWMSD